MRKNSRAIHLASNAHKLKQCGCWGAKRLKSAATRAKMSAAHKGKLRGPLSDEHKHKISEGMTRHYADFRARIRASDAHLEAARAKRTLAEQIRYEMSRAEDFNERNSRLFDQFVQQYEKFKHISEDEYNAMFEEQSSSGVWEPEGPERWPEELWDD